MQFTNVRIAYQVRVYVMPYRSGERGRIESADEFEPVTERIGDVAMRAPIIRQRIRRYDDAMLFKPREQRLIVGASERGVSFRCRTKRLVDADVQSDITAAEPRPAALCEFFGLRDFFEAENIDVKRASNRLAIGWNCQLHMVEAMKHVANFGKGADVLILRFAHSATRVGSGRGVESKKSTI